MITLIILVFVISILVLIHEFGHFYVAKKSGVRVEEFGIGIPPRLYGKKIGETVYSVNLLPFGGFVKLTGEDYSDNLDMTDPKNFMNKSPFKRGAILLAGVFMNVLFAAFVYYVIFFLNGFRTLAFPLFFDYKFRFGNVSEINTVVMSYVENSAAEKAGIQTGEAVLEIDGVPVYSVSDIHRELEFKAGQEVMVLLMDVRSIKKDIRAVRFVVMADEAGKGLLGVMLSKAVTIGYGDSGQKVFAGVLHSYNMTGYFFNTFKEIISMSFETGDITPVSDTVRGPVGIFDAVGGILSYGGREAFLGVLDLVGLLSISLAIINVLPFPALDGGRFVFVFIEMITHKRLKASVEANLHKAGMIFLLALMILVTFKDIRQLLI